MSRLKLAQAIASYVPHRWKLASRGTRFALAARRILNATLPESARTTITGGPLKGYVLFVNLRKEKLFWLATHEPDVARLLQDTVRPGWVCYDVGAHIGYVSLMLAHFTGRSGQVLAFEPDPSNGGRLTKNVAANHLDQVIRVVPCAVSSASGKGRFEKGRHSSTGKLALAARDDALTVGAVALDDFAHVQGHPGPDLIKVDVEGTEADVLAGAASLLSRPRPTILCEVHSQEAAEATLSILQTAGYCVRDVDNEHQPASTERASTVVAQRTHWFAQHEDGQE